ncbi:hypothetical protein E1B28_003945 [Marasmius oreades]|uniref:NADH dehydrogenase [ubiquinone] 1 alpha subcomplex subunit 12 n=1 Tax=Marasmius oreades TaxID=181124 RepID=A0A9P7UXJ7_9AGAR|nr:uncharacterized protein E1B28_003945 [Marasmius oreades]KAG7096516.1 hypothetical protein E1B28_003945 [Marasmius oreades]
MSMLRRIWRAITRPTGFVGRDLEGNSFYERPTPHPSGRTRRVVKYRRPEDQWLYIGGGRRLPIQWSAWLSHTRPTPPTLQELQVDLIRQQRVHHNAEMIKAADEMEREEQRRLLQAGATTKKAITLGIEPTSSGNENTSSKGKDPSTMGAPAGGPLALTQEPLCPSPTKKLASKLLPTTGPDEYKPESWSPRVSVQRGQQREG